jgi:hypothetical protein
MIEVQKSQGMRIIDVLLLGPFMIYAGTKLPSTTLKSIMVIAGVLVISNNLKNYVATKANLISQTPQ